METARVLAGLGYLALVATFAVATYVGVAGPTGLPAAVAPAVAWVRPLPPAGFGAALVLTLWGLWRLVMPAR